MDFFIYLALFFFGLFFRTGYEMRKEKGSMNENNKVLFVAVFGAMTVMWASWFAMCPPDPVRLKFPLWVRFGGFIIEIAGILLAVAALVRLKGLENIKHLVTTGVFSKFHHPMYVGFASWIAGWVMYNGAVISLAAGLVGAANIVYWSRLEESRLEAAYGEEYIRYRRKTWL